MTDSRTRSDDTATAAQPFFGARFSLYPMTDRYVAVIEGAIKGLGDTGLEVETDDVSTFIGGDRDRVFGELTRVFAAAARTGEHVVMTLLLSHGCPGETYCESTGEIRVPAQSTTKGDKSGVAVSAQWSLYPLGSAGYMDVIYREIDRTKRSGVFAKGAHFISGLRGDLTDVIGAIRTSFDAASADAGHVVAHATVSANSPSGRSS
jgi:energy-coupling factor transport system substrate-specific component